jgi:hypothetical protein
MPQFTQEPTGNWASDWPEFLNRMWRLEGSGSYWENGQVLTGPLPLYPPPLADVRSTLTWTRAMRELAPPAVNDAGMAAALAKIDEKIAEWAAVTGDNGTVPWLGIAAAGLVLLLLTGKRRKSNG